MLKRCISAEWLKLRHSRLWLVLMVLPVISALIGCANFFMNQGVLQNEWYSLWSQVGLFYGEFFLPVLIAICCAYTCRLEHSNKNWNTVMTAPVSAASIFLSKLVIIGMLQIFVQGFFFLLYLFGGKLVGLTSPLPAELPGWLFRGWIAAVTIGALQLALSIRIRSFAVPIGISLCATFLGLGMYVEKCGMFFPHSLLTIGMGVLSQEGLTSSQNILFFVMNATFVVLVSAFAIHRLRKHDVIA